MTDSTQAATKKRKPSLPRLIGQSYTDLAELAHRKVMYETVNLSQAAVDEMLIQHILTERLIREIFDNPEFVRRNVVAAEVEKVMQAITNQSFHRNTLPCSLVSTECTT